MAKTEAVTLRIEKPVRDQLDRIAAARRQTRGELVRQLIVDEIRRERNKG